MFKRRSSTPHYQTFPTSPPPSAGPKPLPDPLSSASSLYNDGPGEGSESGDDDSPIPRKQLLVLAIISLAEQTALNSIAPYLPRMVGSFPDVEKGRVGVVVGGIASSFAGAQFATNFFWGKLSDRVGRKPVILLGILFTAACFLAFGFCRTLPQAIVVQVLMGAGNGNQALVSTILGEITDKSNQSTSFKYLPAVYGIGGIIGPMIGGLLVDTSRDIHSIFSKYPYLLPNLVSSVLLALEFLVASFMLEESLQEAKDLPPLGTRIKSLFAWIWQFSSSALRPSYVRGLSHHSGHNAAEGLLPSVDDDTSLKSYLTPNIVVILVTYTIFQLSNVTFNTLYPIFTSYEPPIGRGLSPKVIGTTLSFASFISILFQLVLFDRARDKLGNKRGYAIGCMLLAISFFLMPLVSKPKHDNYKLIYAEIAGVLFVKTIGTVAGLTCFLLLLTNSAPRENVLGALNGLAQTLGAGGRSVGPVIAGGLFSAVAKVKTGDWISWGVWGSISLAGALLSLYIRGGHVEDKGNWQTEEDEDVSEA